MPFCIFTGIEISLKTEVGYDDFLVIGIHNNKLEKKWRYFDLLNFVRKNKGWIAWAHPLRLSPEIPLKVYKNPPDALEVRSSNIKTSNISKISALAKKMNCREIECSDSHIFDTVGDYGVRLLNPVSNDEELIKQLKSGDYLLARKLA